MITNIEEIQTAMLSKAKEVKNHLFKRDWLLTSPGCNKKRKSLLLETANAIPASYIKILEKYSLNGVIIDDFELSPYSFKDTDTVEGLLNALSDPFFPKEFMERHHMYQVGSYDTDLLCVTSGTEQFTDGEVLFVEEGYDIYNPEDSQIHPIAKDFEQFLIILGNFDQVRRSVNEGKQEFLERLKQLEVDERYHSVWLSLF